jgi:heme/copper-type cytochrome/quinol oxidase subunit 3
MEQTLEYNATGIPSGRLGIWTFLASEVMLFGAFISAYIVLRIGSPNFGVPAAELMGIPLGSFNTGLLLISSATMAFAIRGIRQDNVKKYITGVSLTSLLGLSFIVIKLYEYHHKISEGLTISSGLFGSFYYTLTGLHVLHMTGGLIFNTYVLVQALRGRYSSAHHERAEYASLYWYFVDSVWMVLFPLFYLIR